MNRYRMLTLSKRLREWHRAETRSSPDVNIYIPLLFPLVTKMLHCAALSCLVEEETATSRSANCTVYARPRATPPSRQQSRPSVIHLTGSNLPVLAFWSNRGSMGKRSSGFWLCYLTAYGRMAEGLSSTPSTTRSHPGAVTLSRRASQQGFCLVASYNPPRL